MLAEKLSQFCWVGFANGSSFPTQFFRGFDDRFRHLLVGFRRAAD